FFEAAFDDSTGTVHEDFNCPSCGAAVTKASLERRMSTIRTIVGDTIERVEYVPIEIRWRRGAAKGKKQFDSGDRNVLDRVAALGISGFPHGALPLNAMSHGSRL